LHLDAIPSLKQVYFSSRLNEEVFLITGNIILAHYFQSIALFEHSRYHSSEGIERFVVPGIVKFDNVEQKWPIALALCSLFLELSFTAVVGLDQYFGSQVRGKHMLDQTVGEAAIFTKIPPHYQLNQCLYVHLVLLRGKRQLKIALKETLQIRSILSHCMRKDLVYWL
jgi:hypothetical protein